ncbi:MAG: NrfD/PsrC family molybdoenzyme membrane anchor subunit [Candidatus Methanofastidiosia archaeon]
MRKIERDIIEPTLTSGKLFYLVVGILFVIVGWGGYAYLTQIRYGLGVTGLNRPVFWGVYLTNFVFFIGISHAGTLISAILRIVGAEWRRPFTRAAEAITVFSLPFGALSVIVDLGRPDRILNLIRYARLQSPILWDFISISTYLFSSVIFFYLALIPDIATLRDNLDNVSPFKKRLYRILSLGWRGTEKQRSRLNKIMAVMSIFLAMLVVTVHTVVSWIFGMTLQPGWHSTIIGPFFLAGAIFSGTAMVAIVAAIIRKVYHLEMYITEKHFSYLAKFLLALTLAWFYFIFAEYLTEFYGQESPHMAVFSAKFWGEFSPPFYVMFFLCFVVPLSILVITKTRSIKGLVIASLSINLGMWLERFVVIVPSLTRPRLPQEFGIYYPTWVEWSITLAFFAGFILLYMLFSKLFPLISIWEFEEKHRAN